ncbi:helix-turn-helix domain-containing protein [Bacillus sp. USDA818B3_A]|uniref:helix-turn-helix domain-containing protein n=1 Tax=Bacillus sp. USDA818B3_A TaxID=2698834 RepID=UPI001922D37C
MHINLKNFGPILKKFRDRQNLSQEELALNCCLERSYISVLERNIKKPGLKTISVLCRGLGIKASELFKALEDHD